MCNCSTVVAPKKALLHLISPLANLVIAYGTNLVVIVPKAFRTFHDQCPVHIRVLAVFTGTFRVKGGGRTFQSYRFLFPDCRFQCGCRSLGCLQLQHHSQKPLPPPSPPRPPPPLPDLQYPMNSPHYYSRYRKYFLLLVAFFLSIKSLNNVLFLN